MTIKKYTITGGTGYIGSQLLEYLSKDKTNLIFAIVRPESKPKVQADNIKYITFDGTEKSIEKSIEEADYLIHLAALYDTRKDEETTKNLINSNILFSTMLFNIAERVNPYLVISSASTFSALNGRGEDAPASLYAATKQAVETIARAYPRLSVHFLTFPDTYGPNDWRNKIHNIVRKNNQWPFEFKSSSKQEIRMLHVEDVIGHILETLKDNTKGTHIHDIYSTGTLLTLGELSKILTDKECIFNEDAPLVKIPKEARSFSKETGHKNKHIEVKF